MGRTRNLQVGVTKPPADIGGFGRNTEWHKASLRAAYKTTAESLVKWRVRADAVHFYTVGSVTLTSDSRRISIMLLGKAGRSSRNIVFHSAEGRTSFVVDPDGRVFYFAGSLGPFTFARGFLVG